MTGSRDRSAPRPDLKNSIGDMGKIMAEVSRKRLRFIEEYQKDYNGTQAAIRAGYSVKNAAEQASFMLTIPNVIQELEKQEKQRFRRVNVTADRTIAEIANIAYHAVEVSYDNAVGGGITTKTKLDALKLLAQHLKLLTDKVEIGNADGKDFEINVTFDGDQEI
jgi:phage terminase small subunit